MAEGVTPDPGSELEPNRKAELEPGQSKELTKYEPRVTHGHESKFRFTYAVLAGVAIAAVGAAAIFVLAGRPAKPPQWSPWKPSSGGDEALSQIAAHVAPSYHLPTGEQLVAVEGGPLQIQGVPVRLVLTKAPSDFTLLDGKGALFTLCGLGKNCSIKAGKPSRERTLLLQRESLELALYSFRYVNDLQHVVVLLPPAPKKRPTQAMYFRRDDVKPQLARPLRTTLAAKPPSITSLRDGPTKDVLERLTGAEVYNFDLLQMQDASVVLELSHGALANSDPGSTSAGSSKSTR